MTVFFVVLEENKAGSRFSAALRSDGKKNRQQQRQQQIPFGDDNKKDKR
jgi:hypothetical protein